MVMSNSNRLLLSIFLVIPEKMAHVTICELKCMIAIVYGIEIIIMYSKNIVKTFKGVTFEFLTYSE